VRTAAARSRAGGANLLALLAAVAILTVGCGKKGPPLAPLRLVPATVSELSARRIGDDVELRFTLPSTNANGPGRIDLDRIEVYAVTVAPGTVTPANRDLLTKAYAVGTIAVKPAPLEGEEPVEAAPPDPRPAPGTPVSFVDTLTEAKLTPAPLPKTPPTPAPGPAPPPGAATSPPTAGEGAPPVVSSPAPGAETGVPPVPAVPDPPAAAPAAGTPPAAMPPTSTPPAATPPAGTPPAAAGATAQAPDATPPAAAANAPAPAATAPAAPAPTYTVRVYVLRGVSTSGRAGPPSARVAIPLVQTPPPPADTRARFTEKAVVVEWSPPPAGEAGPVLFNVYDAAKPADAGKGMSLPLNPSPLAAPPFEVAGAELGAERCFAVRSVQVVATVPLEGASSPGACVTPRDIFPPATPQGLSLLVLDGAVELVWDAGTEQDLSGYTVLRAEAPGDTLRPITPAPIRETSFRDTTVKSGVRYIYAIVAVDRTGNASPQSPRVEGTAR
jgi:hypothetical protein